MMKKSSLIIFTLMLMFVGIIGVDCSKVSAETIPFNLKPSSSAVKWSDSAAKNASKFENCCYVTPTYFSKTGSIYARSYAEYDTTVYSGLMTISSGGVNVPRSAYYNETAKAGAMRKYKLKTQFKSASSGSSINVIGRFTP